VRRFVLGTAGHVDHGKTTLVNALTGVDTDRLPEEKRRGITIELGFAPWALADDLSVSVIDVPGHRRLVHAMIAGATGMELVLLVVAADEGVMPQTREHIAACELLGLSRAVVAITKVDRVGEELAQLAGEEVRELLGERWQAEVVLCSARTGLGIGALREAIAKALRALPPRTTSPRARLSVDRVFSVKGAGTVVTGTLVEGRLSAGQTLFVVGQGERRESAARALHVHDRAVEVADAPTRLAINLAGLSKDDVARGDVVTDDPGAETTRLCDVTVRAEKRIKHGMSVTAYVGTARSTARVDVLGVGEAETRTVEAGETAATLRLRLHEPLVIVGGDRFVLRGSDITGPAGAVVGGGIVLDARPPRTRPRAKRRSVLEGLAAADATATLRALVAEAAPRPLRLDALATRFPLPARELVKIAEGLVSRGELAKIKGAAVMARAGLFEAATKARGLVAEHQRAAPLDRGMPRETLRRRLAATLGVDAADEAIRLAATTNPAMTGEPIVVEGDIARVPGLGAPALGGAKGGVVEQAARSLDELGLKGLSSFGLGEVTGADIKETRAILAKLVREGVAIAAGELWFSRRAVDELRVRVIAHLLEHKRLTIADFKTLSGLGRKQAIPLLEFFDREGVTRRAGDDRLPGPKATV
jgi:selenocysteine-specific elongation factor